MPCQYGSKKEELTTIAVCIKDSLVIDTRLKTLDLCKKINLADLK